jgi:hypothetical protein
MMNKPHLRLFAILLACMLAAGGTARAGDGESAMISMMRGIPLSAFDSGWLSFADIAVLTANRPGAGTPGSTDAYEQIKYTPEGAALLQAYLGLSAGPADFYSKLPAYRELPAASGIDYFTVRQAMETGIPPDRQMWLAGDISADAVKAALREKGYVPLPDPLAGTEVWCKNGDPATGTKVDLKSRDTSFLFGGNLGQSWPVVFRNGMIGAIQNADAVTAAAYQQEPSLADNGILVDLAQAVPQVSGEETGAIAQMYLMTPKAAGLDLPTIPLPGGDSADGQAGEPLPPYAAIALAHGYTPDAQWVTIALAFGNAADAEAAGAVVYKRLDKAALDGTDSQLMERIGQMAGQRLPFRVIDGASGAGLLMIAFTFPPESAAADSKPAASGAPFRLFVRLLNQRSLNWLKYP